MSTPLVPFQEALAEGCGCLQSARDRDRLRSEYDYRSGVLRGYFFAGAVSIVELTAALEQLRKVHQARFRVTSPKLEGEPRAKSRAAAGA